MPIKSLYSVKDYGAVGDGQTIDTVAIQKTIDTCAAEGGGTVLLQGGIFCSSTIYLKSHINLHIDISATLKALSDMEAYPKDTHYNRYINEPDMDPAFIYGEDLENIVISGDGTIDGNGSEFPLQGGIARPMMIRLLRCKTVKLRNLKLKNAAAWTTAFLDSKNIWVENIDISAQTNYNGDGLDFDGCKNVFISNCRIDGSDDNICLQASSKDYPVKNVHINNCHLSSVCAGIRIGLKSVGDIKNVVINNCTFENIWREGIKIESSEGGTIENIKIDQLIMHNVRRPIYILCNNTIATLGINEYPEIGKIAGVSISNLRITEDQEMKNTHLRFGEEIMGKPGFDGIRIDAHEDYKIESLTLKHIDMNTLGGVKLDNIEARYPIVLDRRKDRDKFSSDNYYPNWSRRAFMDVRNVKGLSLWDLRFNAIEKDEREPLSIEQCEVIIKEHVYIHN